jgi:hypothetical protein
MEEEWRIDLCLFVLACIEHHAPEKVGREGGMVEEQAKKVTQTTHVQTTLQACFGTHATIDVQRECCIRMALVDFLGMQTHLFRAVSMHRQVVHSVASASVDQLPLHNKTNVLLPTLFLSRITHKT